MLDDELTALIGQQHSKQLEGRLGNRHGTTTRQVVFGSRTAIMERPRGRYVNGGSEIGATTWGNSG